MKTIKKIITTLLILNSSFLVPNWATAQTIIPTGDVSGTWTAANSPYQIQGDITVQTGQTLEIQAGVTIDFQGYYELLVNGKLLALGDDNNKIHFTRSDTTGFWNDDNIDGGWKGIDLNDNTVDLSIIENCVVEFIKNYGVFAYRYSNLIINRCVFTNNKSNAIGLSDNYEYTGNRYHFICNNIIANNFKHGISIVSVDNLTAVNNLICNNTSYGIMFGDTHQCFLNNNTICNNLQGGVYRGGDNNESTNIYNCIVWGNGGNQIETWGYGNQGMNIYSSCIQNGEAGIVSNEDFNAYNIISGNPQFINPTAGVGIEYDALAANWKLNETSPCIDAGTPDTTGLHIPTIDLAGEPRIYNDIIDMGAYEYQGYTDNKEITNAKINIYPIPSSETIKILFQRINAPKIFVNVYNMQGETIYKNIIKNKDRYNTETLHFAKFPQVTYLINIKYGNKNMTRKIIIQ